MKVGIIGAGAMGSGIAQVAATAGCDVLLSDTNEQAIIKSRDKLQKILNRLVEKGRLDDATAKSIFGRIHYVNGLGSFADRELVIEAIIENLDIKKSVFSALEEICSEACILASNTSSLPVTAIASACKTPTRVMGLHFFNPAPLMALVEVVPALQTDMNLLRSAAEWMEGWGKIAVITKDTPGFIVNRVARPYYSEALRIYDEGIAEMATIDWAMTELAGFRMGPFTLMDFIGHDVNYKVTESMYHAYFQEPRYKPSFSQQGLIHAGFLGRKSGKGFYDYQDNEKPSPEKDRALCQEIANRIIIMLINEAADALFWNIAGRDEIDIAMQKGVNYPKGLLKWADDLGIPNVINGLDELYEHYHEERYRCSPILRQMVANGQSFYP
jgi:3-hydroxybutyryl-CoA dehydrogenase